MQFKELPREWQQNPALLQLATDHIKWLENPVTQRFLRWLEQRRKVVESRVCAEAVRQTVTDAEVRRLAVELNEITTLQKVTYDTEQFVKATTGNGAR